MSKVAFYRVLKNGFTNFRRNFWLSVAATAIMVITLFTVSIILALNALANLSLAAIQQKVDISVYFRPDATDEIVTQIQKQVEVLPQVKSVEYIPPTAARDKFLALHQNDPLLVEAVAQFSDAQNPFPGSFAIRVNNLSDYQTIINVFQDSKLSPYVQKITDKRDLVDRLSKVSSGVKRAGVALVAIFSAITLLVMFNTIRLTIFNRREEIEIMRLVGASNWFIRGPFIVEGAFYGLVGAIVSSGFLYPILHILTPKITNFLQLTTPTAHYFGLNFWALAGLEAGLGIFFGVVSSLVVIRKYLNI